MAGNGRLLMLGYLFALAYVAAGRHLLGGDGPGAVAPMATTGAAPIIVSATFGAADFHMLDALRRAHFPAERNIIDAHLTLFHHLPPGIAGELDARLMAATRRVPPPAALIDRVLMLGHGVALRVRSEGLAAIRVDLAEAFADCLIPQDRAGWNPHVTIQNKVPLAEARALHAAMSAGFVARPLAIAGIATHYYRGGPWELIKAYRFG